MIKRLICWEMGLGGLDAKSKWRDQATKRSLNGISPPRSKEFEKTHSTALARFGDTQ